HHSALSTQLSVVAHARSARRKTPQSRDRGVKIGRRLGVQVGCCLTFARAIVVFLNRRSTNFLAREQNRKRVFFFPSIVPPRRAGMEAVVAGISVAPAYPPDLVAGSSTCPLYTP